MALGIAVALGIAALQAEAVLFVSCAYNSDNAQHVSHGSCVTLTHTLLLVQSWWLLRAHLYNT